MATRCYLQEICAHDPKTVFSELPHRQGGNEVAGLELSMAPVPSIRSSGSFAGRPAQLVVDLRASGRASILAHDEVYEFCLPSVLLEEPLTPRCRPSLTGTSPAWWQLLLAFRGFVCNGPHLSENGDASVMQISCGCSARPPACR